MENLGIQFKAVNFCLQFCIFALEFFTVFLQALSVSNFWKTFCKQAKKTQNFIVTEDG